MQVQIAGDLEGLEEALAQAGLDGLDAIGRKRLRQVVRQRRQKVGNFTGRHAVALNGLEGLSDAELAGIGKKLKKAAKKIGKVTNKVTGVDLAKKVTKKVVGEETYQKLKMIAPQVLNVIPGVGTAAAAVVTAGMAAQNARKAQKAASAQEAAIDAEAESQANAIFQQQLTSGGGSGGGAGGGGYVYEGQYLSKDEPDPKPGTDGQWLAGIDNNVILLGGAALLSGLLLVSVSSGRRREASHAA